MFVTVGLRIDRVLCWKGGLDAGMALGLHVNWTGFLSFVCWKQWLRVAL